jgi:hypothetical protein
VGNLSTIFSVVAIFSVVIDVVSACLVVLDVDVVEDVVLGGSSFFSEDDGLKPGGRRPARGSLSMSPKRLARPSLYSVLAVVGLAEVDVAVVASESALKPGGRNAAMLSNLRFSRF